MADFCPVSSAFSTPAEPDKRAYKATVASKQPGQLWKKIGIVGSVAVMGGQPVLAQINTPVADAAAPPISAEAAPFIAVAPETPAVIAPPVVVSPEADPPSFSNVDQPVVQPAVEAITSEVEVEIVVSEVEADIAETEAAPAESGDVEIDVPDAEAALVEESVASDEEVTEADESAALEADSPDVEIVTPSDVVPSEIPTVEELAGEYGGVFIDPTAYSEGATVDPNAPEVVISERSTECEYEVDANDQSGCEAADEATTVAEAPEAPDSEASIDIGPVSISRSGIRFSGGASTAAGREFYNTIARPLVNLQAGESFIFPLAAASPITSLFGWRWHPIHGDYRFHSGTDLGAPQGTPILATQSGQVSVADYLGGYGLTVILRHNDNTLESRYAHMSHMLVEAGEWVEQGDVIGLVGSTGHSTGPHLHFELRQLTSQGWTAINPNDVLRYALANLNNRMAGNPLQALNIMPNAYASAAQAALPNGLKSETLVKDAPFRPAQPHAQ
ncbi:MAG: peptidoglycan DD-metalloendopeptidase family protein [Cyanobacteria bacterium P01_H01_bin.21]